jgi:hypothetical protein
MGVHIPGHQEPSALEELFAYQLRCQGDHFPLPERQYRFHDTRKWAFDFAWPFHGVAVEIEGGIHTNGRHVRARGFSDDCVKYNEAALLEWIVLRLTEVHLRDLTGLRWLERAINTRTA